MGAQLVCFVMDSPPTRSFIVLRLYSCKGASFTAIFSWNTFIQPEINLCELSCNCPTKYIEIWTFSLVPKRALLCINCHNHRVSTAWLTCGIEVEENQHQGNSISIVALLRLRAKTPSLARRMTAACRFVAHRLEQPAYKSRTSDTPFSEYQGFYCPRPRKTRLNN